MEGSVEQLRPHEGADVAVTDCPDSPQFTDSFADGRPVDAPISPSRRRGSKCDPQTAPEWDASKVPPSQFQKPRGSFSATPSSRDGHVDRNVDRDKYFHERHRSMFGVIQESVKETKQKIGTVLHRRGSSSASEKKSKW